MASMQAALRVVKLVWPEFEVRDDLVFRKGACPNDIEALRDDVARFDCTAAEAFYNHTHVLDLFDHDARKDGAEDDIWGNEDHPDFREARERGKLVARMLVGRLREAFPPAKVAPTRSSGAKSCCSTQVVVHRVDETGRPRQDTREPRRAHRRSHE